MNIIHKNVDVILTEKEQKRTIDKAATEKPRLSTAKRKKKLLKALVSSLGVVDEACKKAKICRTSFYTWMKDDPDFAEKVKDIEDVALDFVESQHYELIRMGSTKNILFHLKTKGRHRGYGESKELIHKQYVLNNLKDLSDEELEKILDE